MWTTICMGRFWLGCTVRSFYLLYKNRAWFLHKCRNKRKTALVLALLLLERFKTKFSTHMHTLFSLSFQVGTRLHSTNGKDVWIDFKLMYFVRIAFRVLSIGMQFRSFIFWSLVNWKVVYENTTYCLWMVLYFKVICFKYQIYFVTG